MFARTSAPAIEGLDKALVRLHAYERTGADALFLPGLKQRDELDRIAAAVTLPLVVASPHESLLDVDYLASRGVRICAAEHQPFFAALQALYDALAAVRGGALPSQLHNVAPAKLVDTLTRANEHKAQHQEFMRPS